MGMRDLIAPNEWYHCYNRGVDKRIVFTSDFEYERFLILLHVCNGTNQIHASNYQSRTLKELLNTSNLHTGKKLVSIGAFCLMPNHFHLLLQENTEGGISKFMQKVGTAYTMYFNLKHDRTGALFGGKFKSKHIYDDRYLKQAVAYIHLNPLDIFDTDWLSQETPKGMQRLEQKLLGYRFSSLKAFYENGKQKHTLLSSKIFEYFDNIPKLKTMIRDAKIFKNQFESEL